jgi:hypothetical protein
LVVVAAIASLYVSGAGSAASRDDGLTINVFYSATSLQAKLSNGTVLSSGAVVPPGPYSVVVYDSGDDPNPQFTMTGPDASVSSDLNPTGAEIEVPMTFGPFLLQPSASYSISDANLGAGSGIAFTTSATGSSITPGTTTSPGSPGTSKGSGGSPGGTLGTLTLSVGAKGKPVLALAGKPVKKLKAGKYLLIVGDSSKKAGALIGHGKTAPSTLSGAAAVGTTTQMLKLTSGKWYVEASKKGPKLAFTVR